MAIGLHDWDVQTKARATEMARLLVRMGYATNGQLARLTLLDPKQVRRVISYEWDQFEIRTKSVDRITGGRYVIPGNRVRSLVRLTPEASQRWSDAEEIRSFDTLLPSSIPQRLNMVELLICMRHKGLLYDKWDMMLPQDGQEGLHAWLTNVDGGHHIGVFLLPTRLSEPDQQRKGHIYQGILRRVTQHNRTQSTLFLTPTEYFPAALRSLVVFNQKDGTKSYLLPLESFKREPENYLDAIATNDAQDRQTLLENGLRYKKRLPMPVAYDYGALLEFEQGHHRFVDAYMNGSIDRVRSWLDHTFGYQIPGTGHVASAEVYVRDKVVAEALDAVLRTKFKGRYEDSIVEVKPWPQSTQAQNANKPVPDTNAILEDDEWWKVFNE